MGCYHLPVLLQNRVVHFVGRIRMGANGCVYKGILLRHGNAIQGGFPAAADIHHKAYALFLQTQQHFFPVFIKGRVIHMGMGVK